MPKFATPRALLDHLLEENAFERADLDDVLTNNTKEGLHLDCQAGAILDQKGKEGLRAVVREYVSARAVSASVCPASRRTRTWWRLSMSCIRSSAATPARARGA